MLSLVPNVRVMSEPWSFMNLHGLYVRKEISLPQFERLLRSVARLQLKPEVKHPNITHVLVKMSNFAAPQFPTLKKMFPEFTQMFITRQLRPSLRSYVKLYIFLPRLWRSGGKLTEFFFHFLAFPYDDANWWDRYDWLWAVDRQYLSYGTEANMCLIWATGILVRTKINFACYSEISIVDSKLSVLSSTDVVIILNAELLIRYGDIHCIEIQLYTLRR